MPLQHRNRHSNIIMTRHTCIQRVTDFLKRHLKCEAAFKTVKRHQVQWRVTESLKCHKQFEVACIISSGNWRGKFHQYKAGASLNTTNHARECHTFLSSFCRSLIATDNYFLFLRIILQQHPTNILCLFILFWSSANFGCSSASVKHWNNVHVFVVATWWWWSWIYHNQEQQWLARCVVC